MEQRRGGLFGHSRVTIRGSRHHTFEKTEYTTYLRHAIEGGNQMHFGGAGFVKQASTPPAISVRIRLSAPFILLGVRS